MAKAVLQTATKQNYTCGKWSSWVYPADVDTIWAKVTRDTTTGKLGYASKVLPTKKENMKSPSEWQSPVAVCVFIDDFNIKP